MKKWIVVFIVVGMVGWAVIDFLDFGQDDQKTAQPVEEVETKTSEPLSESNQAGGEATGIEAEIGLKVGSMAPDFTLENLEGETVRLSDFLGERVMINFWATWCPPCRAEMPDLEKFHKNSDIVLLGVNLSNTENSLENVENFVEEYELTFPILMDQDSVVATMYQIQPIPTSFMVDSHGKISNIAYGPLNYDLMMTEYERMD